MLKRMLARTLGPAETEELVATELDAILKLCHPQLVYLFGSASRGQMTDASDLDFLVVLADGSDFKGIKRAYYCRKREHSYPVDIIFMSEKEFEVKSLIGGVAMICRREGRLMHGKPHD